MGVLAPLALAGAIGFLPGSGGIVSAAPPLSAVLRMHSEPAGPPEVPAMLLVRRGARVGTIVGADRCAASGHGVPVIAPRPTGRPRHERPSTGPLSRRDAPRTPRAPPSPIS